MTPVFIYLSISVDRRGVCFHVGNISELRCVHQQLLTVRSPERLSAFCFTRCCDCVWDILCVVPKEEGRCTCACVCVRVEPDTAILYGSVLEQSETRTWMSVDRTAPWRTPCARKAKGSSVLKFRLRCPSLAAREGLPEPVLFTP